MGCVVGPWGGGFPVFGVPGSGPVGGGPTTGPGGGPPDEGGEATTCRVGGPFEEGGCCLIAAMINGRLGSGWKSTISGCVCISRSRSMFTGLGRVVAPAGTSSIWPARTFRNKLGLLLNDRFAVPSRVMSLLAPSGVVSKITVVPVTATVTTLLRMVPPPEFLGTRSKTEPASRFTVRPALLKLKIVFAPSRVIVRSAKVSSERESPPVRTPVSSVTLSSTRASRESAFDGSNFTSRMIWVTRASFAVSAEAPIARMQPRLPNRNWPTRFISPV